MHPDEIRNATAHLLEEIEARDEVINKLQTELNDLKTAVSESFSALNQRTHDGSQLVEKPPQLSVSSVSMSGEG